MARRSCLLVALILSLHWQSSAAGVEFRGYSPEQGYQYFTFGSYPQAEDGAALPILWRVLEQEDGVLYAVSDAILDVGRIDGDQWDYKGWTQSELYTRLNTDVLNTAFSAEEQTALQEYPELGFISLPSAEDIKNPRVRLRHREEPPAGRYTLCRRSGAVPLFRPRLQPHLDTDAVYKALCAPEHQS